jgi:exodeoxyribonuclease V alpha subunit
MPTRKGNYGTLRVNPSLQLKFNGSGPFLRLDRHDDKEAPLTIRGDDKFLWTKNDYALGMFNGEIGQVEWISTEDGSLSLLTADRAIVVPSHIRAYSPYHQSIIQYDPRKHIELGYAVTTHKSQGSEFDTIIYCICGGQAYMLNRQNIYTAVTRAKKQVIIICDRRSMGLSLKKAWQKRY